MQPQRDKYVHQHLHSTYHLAVVTSYLYSLLDPTITAEGESELQLIHLAVIAKGTDSDFSNMLAALQDDEYSDQ